MSMPYDVSGPGDEAYRRWRHLHEQADAEHDALLVSDAERDQCAGGCRPPSARVASPHLSLDQRTSRALAARTYGDLEDVMAGLEPPATTSYRPVIQVHSAVERGVLPRVVFWVVGLFTAPFILGGGAMVLFGGELGTTIFGLVMLTLFLPGLIALYRWAHPKT